MSDVDADPSTCRQVIDSLDPADDADYQQLLYLAAAALERATTANRGGVHAPYTNTAATKAAVAAEAFAEGRHHADLETER